MQENKSVLGPSIAIVVIVAAVAIGGIVFYKNMIKDILDEGAQEGVVSPVPVVTEDNRVPNEVLPEESDLSESSDIAAIEADLEFDLEESIDLSFIDALDEELLDFDDLDSINFDF